MTHDTFADIEDLRSAHDALLAALDAERERTGPSAGDRAALLGVVASARAFVARALATGMSLDDLEDRTAAQVLVDYWCTRLARVGEACADEELAPFDASRLPELPDSDMPFGGPAALSDAVRFFGREAETRKLLALVQATPLVLVSGPAGCGKSSLVMAGLLPALRAAVGADGRPAWRVPDAVRAGPSWQADLAGALQAAARGTGPGTVAAPGGSSRTPWLAAIEGAAQSAGAPLVVTIDQAESVFSQAAEAAQEAAQPVANEAVRQATHRATHQAAQPAPPGSAKEPANESVNESVNESAAGPAVAALMALLGAGRGHRVVLVLREEFEARVLLHPLLAPWCRGEAAEGATGPHHVARFPVGVPTPEGLRAAIVGPARRVGLHVQPEVVDDLVNLVAGQRSALKLLQHALGLLWAARRRNRVGWDEYLPLRSGLEADKWRFESEHQAAAAQREHAAAERERASAQREHAAARRERANAERERQAMEAERALARRSRRQLRWALLGLAVFVAATIGLGATAVYQRQVGERIHELERLPLGDSLEQMRAEQAQQLDRQRIRIEALQAENRALRAQAGAVPPGALPVRPARSAPPASPGAATLPGATPVPARTAAPPGPASGPASAAAIGVASAAATAATTTAAAAGAAASAAARADGPTGQPSALPPETVGADEKRWRARRLVHFIDTQRPGASAEELRRLHVISFSWARSRWEELNLQTALSLAVLFDTAVAQGPLQAATMRMNAAPIDGTPAAERKLVESYLARRVANAANALHPQDEPRRVEALRRHMAQDWQLPQYASDGS
ncbi:MAG: hypothetical protein JNJ89_05680 [Rubrivivax sp.]|nr:hypothetical protein [Rubrivivax sp.]